MIETCIQPLVSMRQQERTEGGAETADHIHQAGQGARIGAAHVVQTAQMIGTVKSLTKKARHSSVSAGQTVSALVKPVNKMHSPASK